MNFEDYNLPNEFINQMKDLLTHKDFEAYINSFKQSPQKAIRINTTKINEQKFLSLYEGQNLEKVPYFEYSYYSNKEKVGKNILHQIGCFYSQDPSSMMPIALIRNLDIEGKRVLDMCASPGGKSLQIANLVGKEGLIASNEIVPLRAKILQSNVERLGQTNFIVLNDNPKNISNNLRNTFDIVIVDAPCSGEGMFRKDPKAITEWSVEGVKANQYRQKQIIDEADKCLKNGGYLIYSTCTYSKLENEDIASYIEEKGYKIVKIDEKIKKIATVSLLKENTCRCIPGLMRGEGQFCVLLKKDGYNDEIQANKKINYIKNEIADNFIKENLNLDFDYHLEMVGGYICIVPENNIDTKNLKVVSKGVILGQIVKNRLEPHHQIFSAYGKYFNIKLDVTNDKELLKKYLRGEQLSKDLPKGYGVIIYHNVSVGGFKSVNGDLKNLYPKGLRGDYE